MVRLSPLNLIRAIGIAAAVAALTAFTALTASYLLFPVTGLEVQGARMFPEREAWEELPGYASLPSLNTSALEREIEANPWVEGAKVLKDWESGIVTVEVEERRAVLDGDLGDRRIVLAADGTELPGLGGADLTRLGLDETQLEEILAIVEVLDRNGVVLDSVDTVSAEGIEVTAEGYRMLFAGGVGDEQARALKGLMEKHPDAAYFDLRSPDRVVVSPENSGG